MSSFDLWPFEDVRSVGRRGELEILVGTAPDGPPVTIVRVAPEAASDAGLRRRFKDAVEAATRQAGADDPPILWADTATLVPWAATYDDRMQRGADLIGGIFASGASGASGAGGAGAAAAPSLGVASGGPPAGPSGEKSIPALDGPEAAGPYPGAGVPPTAHAMPQGPGAPPFPPPPPPGGQPPGPPGDGPAKRGSRAPLFIALGVGGLVLVLLLGTGISLGLTRERDPLSEPGTKPPASSSTGTHTVQFSPGPSTSSATPSASPTTTKPTLKSRQPVSVYGPTWKKGDKTFTMSFGQLGWSFRAPGDYDCLVVEDKARKLRINCLKLGAKKREERRLLIVDRKCTGSSCSAAERRTCETDIWGTKLSDKMRNKDKHTKYTYGTGRNKKTKQRLFYEYMGYYYKDDEGNRNRHVLVYGDSPKGDFATQIQKTINDIRTQAG
ncbi:MAG: hypothetical protein GEV07_13435 [Streptosporangiales bacterium]|nr:hypothetical protein [Streptosporangiales bacterium]